MVLQTLFSTSFFNFQPENEGEHVSHWYWLYWVITLGLTFIVLIGWLFSQRALEKIKSIPVIGEIRAKYQEREEWEQALNNEKQPQPDENEIGSQYAA